MVNLGKFSRSSTKLQIGGFVGVLALFIVSLLVPTTISSLLFYSGLFVYTVLFPTKALTFLLIYFPARSFYIEINPDLKALAEVIVFGGLLHILVSSRKQLSSLFHFYWFELAFLAFCLIGSISAYLNDVGIMAIVTQLRAFLLMYLVFYIMKRLVLKKDDFQWYLWTTFFIASILSILGIIEKISDKTWLFPAAWEGFAISPTNGDRIYGLAKNPNVLSSFLVIALFTSMYLKQQLVGWKHKMVWVGIILIGITSVLTYSRGTMLALGVALIVYVIWKRNWKNVLQIGIVLATSAVLALYVVEPATSFFDIKSQETEVPVEPGSNIDEDEKNAQKERIKETFSSDTLGQSASSGRLWIIERGFDVFKDYPIAGSGFATFGDSASLAYGSPIYTEYEMRPDIYSDNQYIQIIAQTGILGVLAFAAFLISIFVMLLKKRNEPVAMFTLLLFVAVVSSCVVYNTWEDKTVTLFMFGFMGIVFSNQSASMSRGVDTSTVPVGQKQFQQVSHL